MPGFNATGPNGQGPRTGRGLGKCKPAKSNKEENFSDFDRGRGMGRGMGRGYRHGYGRGMGGGRSFGGGRGYRHGFGHSNEGSPNDA